MAATPLTALIDLLDDMRAMVERVDDESYGAPARGRRGGGIGSHVRHCLDHVSALASATGTGFCAYDRRARGTADETDRASALDRIDQLVERLDRLDTTTLDSPVAVETQIDAAGTSVVTSSTVAREIVFVMSHTIHHNAILARLLDESGVVTGARFGVAPATPVHQDQMACAR